MHRFDLDNVACARRMRDKGLYASIAGRQEGATTPHRPPGGRRRGADYITIDIAHGHADSVQNMIEHIKAACPPPS
jgi:GMP reductase